MQQRQPEGDPGGSFIDTMLSDRVIVAVGIGLMIVCPVIYEWEAIWDVIVGLFR